MLIVRFTHPVLAEFGRSVFHFLIRHNASTMVLGGRVKPPKESPIFAQFFPEFAADNKLSPWPQEPLEEMPSCWWPFAAENLSDNICIDDGTH
ncbi:MAG: hypothetical protein OXT71_18645 [Acidobacteriota bacterium]|nr:hypothetical protein [Acidobacteriota bacterium]